MKLGHAPPNKFMPNAENLKNMKLDRENAKPVIISKSDNFEVWYKQDDSFEQPFVFIEGKVMTNDCDFPIKIESQLLTQLWKCMLMESLREMGYMAELAGTSLSLTVNSEYLKLNYFAFNDNIEAYLAEVFGSL